MADFNDIVFKNKTFAGILEEIHTNQKKKEKMIMGLIQELKPLVKELGDATILVPLIASYTDLSIKNDDALIKMAGIVQRHIQKQTNGGTDGLGLSEEEKKQLLKEVESLGKK